MHNKKDHGDEAGEEEEPEEGAGEDEADNITQQSYDMIDYTILHYTMI